MIRTKELVIYRAIRKDDIFHKMEQVITAWETKKDSALSEETKEELWELLFDGIHGLIEEGQKRSFYGNLWQAHLTYLMANDENSFSRFCEKRNASTLNSVLSRRYFSFASPCRLAPLLIKPS